MEFDPPLTPATLIKRYKRFLADVKLANGEIITVHTPNTGSMMGLAEPGMKIWLRDTQNPKRKYRHSWEMCEPRANVKVGIHTGIVNQLVSEAINKGIISELTGYTQIQQEKAYGIENSRIDLLLSAPARQDCYVEIKNVTAIDSDNVAIFPDAVTTRGQKHLRELVEVVNQGQRAVMFYCIQRTDSQGFRPAIEIDPDYAALLTQATDSGVEVVAYSAELSPHRIEITKPVKILHEEFT